MHPDQLPIDAALVRSLLAEQHPGLADRPLVPVTSAGTGHALFRLGADLAVRLPLTRGGRAQVDKEHAWLPRLAPRLPLPVPVPIARGEPTAAFPAPWTVCRWLPGTDARPDRASPRTAEQLAAFVTALHTLDPTAGPAPGDHNFGRGVPLADRDVRTRAALAELDRPDLLPLWDDALAAPAWDRPGVWVHGDLLSVNLLADDDLLTGVIDWGGLGVGDPAVDLLPAWNLLDARSRPVYRAALAVDDATWARGRGWALSVAAIALPYYRDTNPTVVAWAERMLAAVS